MPDNANSRKIAKDLDLLQRQIGDLYSNTYYSSDNSEEFKTQITDRLDTVIRNSTQNDDEYKNIANTTKLFKKLMKTNNAIPANKLNKAFGTGSDSDISSLFQTNQLVSSLMDNYSKTKWIKELDDEFDLITKYMPKLQAALDIKRDAVLCSDSYTKEFLNVRAKNENPLSEKNAAIQNNISEMIKKYNLSDKAETWYEDTSKYGEEFVYCVPYDIALNQLLKRKATTNYAISESAITTRDVIKEAKAAGFDFSSESNKPVLKVTFDHSKLVAEAVNNNYYLQKASGNDMLKGLSESFVINERSDKFEDHLKKDGKETSLKFDNTIDDEIAWEDDDKSAADGLVNDDKNKDKKLKVNGAVVRTFRHDKIIPIYIEDTLFGAYIFKFNQFENPDINAGMGTTDTIKANSISGMFSNGSVSASANADIDYQNSQNILLKTIAGQLSKKIDAEFINANLDLKKEIYQILKFNDTYNQSTSIEMNITFIPADDIHHLKFKEDPDTHRGISDLWDSLVPAKQWITVNLTSILGWTTRGFDRRVYYVKQSLDTNTAQSLLNVISTIKKGNFGVRQMESVNNILNIVGRFNDFVIPMGPSGEPPIQFDTQPGQQFDFPQDLQNTNEEAAVNATGVPLEIVNSSTGMDFAVRYTMTNAKLLRNVLKRQLKMEDFLSDVFSKIYKFEYNDNTELQVTLPPPAFLSMTQGTQLLNTATQYADAITEIEMANESDIAKTLFKKRIIRKLIPSYMSDDDIANIKNEVILDTNIDKSRAEDEI